VDRRPLSKATKILLAIAGAIAFAALWSFVRRYIPSTMDYQGQKIKLSKFYLSFEDYKDDPDNIAPSENGRVAQLVEQAPIQRQFPDRKELIDALFEIKFPGYGFGSYPASTQPDGTTLEMYSIEIPRTDRNRYFTFQKSNGIYTLVDDFLDSGMGLLDNKVRLENGLLVYSLENGKRTVTHPLKK
jgi:hypothetical protein